jgi:hypothetical protein
MICIYENNVRNVNDMAWHLCMVIKDLVFAGISHLLKM